MHESVVEKDLFCKSGIQQLPLDFYKRALCTNSLRGAQDEKHRPRPLNISTFDETLTQSSFTETQM